MQDLAGHALALTDQTEQDVLGADVVVPQLQRFTQRQLQDGLGPRGEGDVATGSLLPGADVFFDLSAHGFQGDAEALQSLGRDAIAFVDQPEQDVLGANVVVRQHACFFLGQHDDSTSAIGEPLEHGRPLTCLGPDGKSVRLPALIDN